MNLHEELIATVEGWDVDEAPALRHAAVEVRRILVRHRADALELEARSPLAAAKPPTYWDGLDALNILEALVNESERTGIGMAHFAANLDELKGHIERAAVASAVEARLRPLELAAKDGDRRSSENRKRIQPLEAQSSESEEKIKDLEILAAALETKVDTITHGIATELGELKDEVDRLKEGT